jgi:hypothetical protein
MSDMEHLNRNVRQNEAQIWAAEAFGGQDMNHENRAKRFVEEALELAQACGLQRWDVLNVFNHVYDRPPGEVTQEVGGVGVTLLCLCEALHLSADGCERAELSRVQAKPAAHWQARLVEKQAAGL